MQFNTVALALEMISPGVVVFIRILLDTRCIGLVLRCFQKHTPRDRIRIGAVLPRPIGLADLIDMRGPLPGFYVHQIQYSVRHVRHLHSIQGDITRGTWPVSTSNALGRLCSVQLRC